MTDILTEATFAVDRKLNKLSEAFCHRQVYAVVHALYGLKDYCLLWKCNIIIG